MGLWRGNSKLQRGSDLQQGDCEDQTINASWNKKEVIKAKNKQPTCNRM